MWIRKTKGEKRRGSTAVEMAFIAGPFFFLLLGMVEVSLLLTAQQLMENVTYNVSRMASTGYVASGSSQLATINSLVNQELSGFGSFFDTTQVTVTSTSYSSFAAAQTGTNGTNGFGTPQQIVVYTVSYPWQFLTSMIGSLMGTCGSQTNTCTMTISSQMVVRNEPYN